MSKLLSALLLAGLAATASAQPTRAANACRGERVVADLGYDGITCRSCTFTSGYAEYLTEPSISDIRRGGPADGKLRDGDVLVAVEGALITTRTGWRRMRDIEPGEPVTLTVRRNGYERDVTITPGARCAGRDAEAEEAPVRRAESRDAEEPRIAEETRSLADLMRDSLLNEIRRERVREAELRALENYTRAQASRAAAAAAVSARASASSRDGDRGWIGLAIECGSCGAVATGRPGQFRWTFEQPPVVSDVVAGGPAAAAGIRRGDVLVEIDGRRITTSGGGSRWGQIRPGESVLLTIRRGRETREVEVTARERADRLPTAVMQASPLRRPGGFGIAPVPRPRFDADEAERELSGSRPVVSRHLVGDAIVELEGRNSDVKIERDGDAVIIRGPDFTIRVRPRD